MPVGKLIQAHRDLDVYKDAFAAAMHVFEVTRSFPKDERFGLSDQVRRSSRSVAANIAEAWRKRRYEAAFISKLSDAEAEAAETQVWIEFAVKCRYLARTPAAELYRSYERLIRSLVGMALHASEWTFQPPVKAPRRSAPTRHVP